MLASSDEPWYSPRRRGSISSASNVQLAADRNSSAPVSVTWPRKNISTVSQPTVSWVDSVMRHEVTKNTVDTRIARSAVGRSLTPRAAAIGRKMHITVLVPKSSASTDQGASVFSTSHRGITTLRITWLVHMIPLKNSLAMKPGLRSGPGPGILTLRSSTVLWSWGALGSRVIARALTRKTVALNHGTFRSWLSD